MGKSSAARPIPDLGNYRHWPMCVWLPTSVALLPASAAPSMAVATRSATAGWWRTASAVQTRKRAPVAMTVTMTAARLGKLVAVGVPTPTTAPISRRAVVANPAIALPFRVAAAWSASPASASRSPVPQGRSAVRAAVSAAPSMCPVPPIRMNAATPQWRSAAARAVAVWKSSATRAPRSVAFRTRRFAVRATTRAVSHQKAAAAATPAARRAIARRPANAAVERTSSV